MGFKFQVWLVQAQSIGSRAAAGKTENCAGQGSRATASYTSQTPDRKEGTQHAARDSAGFQVPATRSQCASGPGSEPGIAVARTQHRVRAAAGCVHNGRPGNWSRTCQSAAVQGSSFTGPAYQEPRGSGPRGQTPQATTRKGLVPQTSVTMAARPSIS